MARPSVWQGYGRTGKTRARGSGNAPSQSSPSPPMSSCAKSMTGGDPRPVYPSGKILGTARLFPVLLPHLLRASEHLLDRKQVHIGKVLHVFRRHILMKRTAGYWPACSHFSTLCQSCCVPLKLLRSTLPATPGTLPVVVNCQNAQERGP